MPSSPKIIPLMNIMATQSSLSSTFPSDALEIIKSRSPREQFMKRALALQFSFIRKMGQPILKDLGIHPVYPFSKFVNPRNL